MTKLLTIADDLTGAVDVGAQFAGVGVSSYVALNPNCDVATRLKDFDVLVINSETRHSESSLAAKCIERIAQAGKTAGVQFFYKKTDSTLRGNIGSELNALRQTAGSGRLIFVPALPQLGRTTVNGFHYVHGQPLHMTAFARDPLNPITDNFIPRIIGQQTATPTIVLTRDSLKARDERDFRQDAIYVIDAESDADLKQIAEFLSHNRLLGTLAAPAGLAKFIPDHLGFKRSQHSAKLPRGPMLLINGSVNEVSLRQAAWAASNGFKDLPLTPRQLLEPSSNLSEAVERILAESAADSVAADLLLRSARTPKDVQAFLELGASHGLHGSELHLQIARNLARIVRRIVEMRPTELLIIFGGDTFAAIARELQWDGFYPCSEVLPGVTHSKTETGLHILSKAGGFGEENLIQELKRRINNQ
jgi:D-threonate/D-erythronate kinase